MNYNIKLKYIGQYELLNTLGEGTYGPVKLARHTHSTFKDQFVAVKQFPKTKISSQVLTHLSLENEIYTKLKGNPRVCQLLSVIETTDTIYQIFEYLEGGDLFDYVMSNKHLSALHSIQIFKQICTAVKDLHSLHYSHHDLKLENIMLKHSSLSSSHFTIKLIDFGLSALIPTSGILSTFAGTEEYAPPEILLGRPYLGKSIDVYALGVILYVMLNGRFPFKPTEEIGVNEHLRQKNSNEYISNLKYVYGVSDSIKELVSKCLRVDGRDRPSIESILEDVAFEMEGKEKSETEEVGDKAGDEKEEWKREKRKRGKEEKDKEELDWVKRRRFDT